METKKVSNLFKDVCGTLIATNEFYVARDQAINVKDNIKLPVIALISVNPNTENEKLIKTFQCVLKFMQKDELSVSENSKNSITYVMDRLKDEFISKLNYNEEVSLLTNISSSFFYNQYDQNYTGVQLNLTIELYYDDRSCE